MTWFIYVETYQKTYYLLDGLISSISESNETNTTYILVTHKHTSFIQK